MFYNGLPFIGKVVVSVSIDVPSNSQQDAPFHHIAYDDSHPDWHGLHDHLKDVAWKDIFKLSASAGASEFCEWFQVGIGVYIPHCKYQVKSHQWVIQKFFWVLVVQRRVVMTVIKCSQKQLGICIVYIHQ